MSDLAPGMTDGESYMMIVLGVRRFMGHQVIGFEKAWRLCTGLELDDMEPDEAQRLRWLLEELGYERQWVAELGRTNMQHVWVREPWHHDFTVNLNRPVVAYVSMS